VRPHARRSIEVQLAPDLETMRVFLQADQLANRIGHVMAPKQGGRGASSLVLRDRVGEGAGHDRIVLAINPIEGRCVAVENANIGAGIEEFNLDHRPDLQFDCVVRFCHDSTMREAKGEPLGFDLLKPKIAGAGGGLRSSPVIPRPR
jgi:hypothetical protein